MLEKPVGINRDHDLSKFDCGKKPLSEWLKKHALQSQASGQSKTMVVVDDANSVIGYYAFSIVSVEHEEATHPRVKKGMAKFSIPVFLLAKLAVDSTKQGEGLGGRLLLHALKRVAVLSLEVPIRAVIVDAIDPDAKAFYEKFDFEPWPIDDLRMWLLLKDLLPLIRKQQGTEKEPESAESDQT